MSSNQQLLLGEGAGSAPAVFVEDVFSTYLYTGNGSTQTITNNIDLSTKGGLVWLKSRSAAYGNRVQDTVRGAGSGKALRTNGTEGETASNSDLTAFTSSGFSLGYVVGDNNASGTTNVSWTFRKQPKFFDVVTYTGTGSNTTIAHNLGAVPGCIIVKRTDTSADWAVYHRSLANTEYLVLNTTAAKATGATWWNSTTPTSSVFSIGTDASVNASGGTYVAYIYGHDAGGFGLAGTDNVISCGSFTTDGSGNATVNLGYEPQWLMTKVTSTTGGWRIFDTMRGWSSGIDALLVPNNNGAEYFAEDYGTPTATGMNITNHGTSLTWIYIAIRRGPMKVPTVGTSVYNGITRTGTAANATVTGAGFPVDLLFSGSRSAAFGTIDFDRLRGATQRLFTYSTAAEAARATSLTSFAVQDGYTVGDDATDGGVNNSGQTYIYWNFRRAPGFFDEVCYTGTGGASQTFTHNLGVAPELIIVKNRDAAAAWESLGTALSASQRQIYLNRDAAGVAVGVGHLGYNGTDGAYKAPTSTVVYFGGDSDVGGSGVKYVAYLFATCAGVSKVGTYTGNGSNQTIACGFTAGSRFVLIKRTDSTGDWYVWDSARGIVAGNDPHLSLNDTAAEVTTDDSVDTDNSGFIVNQLAATNVNVTSATYIFLAIA